MKILRGEAVRLKAVIRPLVVKRYLATHSRRLLNIGSGPHRREGWLCADAFKSEADIYLNATSALPFESNTFDVVYSEHMIEHIKVDNIPMFLREIYRILRPGGVFRVTTPDLEIHAKNYISKNDSFFAPIIDKYKARWDRQKNKYWLIRSNGGAFMSRAVQRFYRHRWMYDFETLSSCLTEVGFSSVHKMAFSQSHVEEGKVMDREDRAFETLYVEAIK